MCCFVGHNNQRSTALSKRRRRGWKFVRRHAGRGARRNFLRKCGTGNVQGRAVGGHSTHSFRRSVTRRYAARSVIQKSLGGCGTGNIQLSGMWWHANGDPNGIIRWHTIWDTARIWRWHTSRSCGGIPGWQTNRNFGKFLEIRELIPTCNLGKTTLPCFVHGGKRPRG